MTLPRYLLVSAFVAALVPLFVPGCAPSPKNVPCSNAGDCEAADPDFHYCVNSLCVECLDDSGCGGGNKCTAGACERHCRDGRDCRKGERCTEHMCGD